MRRATWSVLILLAVAGRAAAAEAEPAGTVAAFWREAVAAAGACDAALFDRLFTPLAAARFKREIRERKPEYHAFLRFQLPQDPAVYAPVEVGRSGGRATVEHRPAPGVIAETYVFDLRQAPDGWRIASVQSVLSGPLRPRDTNADDRP